MLNLYLISLDTEHAKYYMKLYVLLYVDGTVNLAESPEECQATMNAMYLNRTFWNLKVNPAKTKIVIFSKIKVDPKFNIAGEPIKVESEFSYLD
jgi:hypothetical protein